MSRIGVFEGGWYRLETVEELDHRLSSKIETLEADNRRLAALVEAAFWYRIDGSDERTWVLCRGCSIPKGGWPNAEPWEVEHMAHCWVAPLLAATDPAAAGEGAGG